MNTQWNCIRAGVNLLVSDYSEFLKLIKQAAVEAVEAGNPAAICYGQVTSVSPLKILADQKMTLGSAQLVVPEHLTDYEIEVTVKDWNTETASSHTHPIKGKKKVVMHGALKSGDKVLLVREQGGQKYIVIDRMVK